MPLNSKPYLDNDLLSEYLTFIRFAGILPVIPSNFIGLSILISAWSRFMDPNAALLLGRLDFVSDIYSVNNTAI